MTVVDLLQLSPVSRKLIFSQFSGKIRMRHSLGLRLWHLFKYSELTEVLRQNEKLLIKFSNKKTKMMLKSYSRQYLHWF